MSPAGAFFCVLMGFSLYFAFDMTALCVRRLRRRRRLPRPEPDERNSIERFKRECL